MIQMLIWATRHATRLPYAVALIACFDPSCECAAIPFERKLLAAELRFSFDGTLPPLVKLGERYLGLLELEEYLAGLLPELRSSLLKTMPSEYTSQWRGCKIKGCHHWFKEKTAMQRHVQLAHPGLNLSRAFESPFICGFKFERAIGSLGVPEGPNRYCSISFDTEKELAAHKSALNHVKPAPKKGKKKVAPAVAVAERPVEVAQNAVSSEEESEESQGLEDAEGDIEEEGGEVDGAIEVAEQEPDSAEVIMSEDNRRQTKRAPTTTLRDTFLALIDGIKSRSEAGRCTVEEGVRSIVQCLMGKAFVRSDSEEENARRVAKAVKVSSNQEGKMKLLTDLCNRLKNLDFF
jgi:hypothetical protein